MKLKALGIDSTEFDSERAVSLRRNIVRVYNWILDSKGGEEICEAASILDKLVTRKVPLVQYRGMRFEDPAIADALLGGGMASKHPCESWTPSLEVAERFATERGPRPVFRYVTKRTLSKSEVILDVDGLTKVLTSILKEFKVADQKGQLHSSMDEERVHFTKVLEYFLRASKGFNESQSQTHLSLIHI